MSTPTVLTRRELYDLVWSKPMRDLASEYGISDVGLAKICDRHRVPMPARGFWAKLEAGKNIPTAIFREVDDPALNRVEIRSGLQQLPAPAREIIARAKAERKAAKPAPRTPATPPSTAPVQHVHKSIRRTAQVLRKAKPDANGAAQAIGDGLCGVDVALANVERVIAFLHALAHKLEARGLPFEPSGDAMRVTVGPDSAAFTIKEQRRREKHDPTPEDLAAEERRQKKLQRYWATPHRWDREPFNLHERAYPEFDVIYTGALVFQVVRYSDGVRRKWADGKTQTVESLLDDIVVGLEALLAVRRAKREEREKQKLRWQERSQRREVARKRVEREERRTTYLNTIIDVHHDIKRLRRWLARIEPASETGSGSDFGRMIDWARQRLATLETTVDPERLDHDLRKIGLFPETDELYDPESDPPDEP